MENVCWEPGAIRRGRAVRRYVRFALLGRVLVDVMYGVPLGVMVEDNVRVHHSRFDDVSGISWPRSRTGCVHGHMFQHSVEIAPGCPFDASGDIELLAYIAESVMFCNEHFVGVSVSRVCAVSVPCGSGLAGGRRGAQTLMGLPRGTQSADKTSTKLARNCLFH